MERTAQLADVALAAGIGSLAAGYGPGLAAGAAALFVGAMAVAATMGRHSATRDDRNKAGAKSMAFD